MTATQRKLTPLYLWLTANLGGRPVLAYLWMLWSQFVLTFVFYSASKNSDSEDSVLKLVAGIGLIGLIVAMLRFAYLVSVKPARLWLMARCAQTPENRVTIFSQICVLLVPGIALILLLVTAGFM